MKRTTKAAMYESLFTAELEKWNRLARTEVLYGKEHVRSREALSEWHVAFRIGLDCGIDRVDFSRWARENGKTRA